MGKCISYLLQCNEPSQTYCLKTILSQDSVAWPAVSWGLTHAVTWDDGWRGQEAKTASSARLGLVLAAAWAPLFSSTWPPSP